MDTFVKTAACTIIILVLCIILGKQGKDFSLILTIAGCSMIAIAAISYLDPVIDFVEKLQIMGSLDTEMFTAILKSVGIALLGEVSCLICTDSGNAALGKTLQLLSSAVILWLSVPLFNGLIELVEKILVAV